MLSKSPLGLDPYPNAAVDRPMGLTASGYVPMCRSKKSKKMTPYKWPALTAVPQTLEKRLEVMQAIQTLVRQDEDLRLRQQQTESAARHCLIEQFELAVHELCRSCDPRLRSRVLKYDPDQPRVPAGNPHGGEWTSEDESGTSPASTDAAVAEGQPHSGRGSLYATLETNVVSDAGEGSPPPLASPQSTAQRIEVAGNDWRNLPVNLAEEEAPNGPGHAIRKHVGKTEAELLGEFEQDNRYGLFYDEIRKREGSFDSIENANDLVNQTLRANSEKVDRVANGQVADDYIQYRFDSVTGYEVYRTDPNYPRFKLRKTYGVGVEIRHDPSSPRGFRVITAYPRNFD